MAERVSQSQALVVYKSGDAKQRVSQAVALVPYQSGDAKARVSQTVLLVMAPLADWGTPATTGRSFAVIIG